ncbi:hypothetical protein Tco_0453164 [Tanacetum coccineum]
MGARRNEDHPGAGSITGDAEKTRRSGIWSIRRIQSLRYGVSGVSWSRDHAQIRRIFLDGYGVLVVRTVIFKYLRLSSRMRAF